MAKLTDSQLVVLSAAAQRADGLVLPLPKSVKLNKGAAATVLQSLLKSKLVVEIPAAAGQDVWRTDGEIKLTLKLTESALKHLDAPKAVPPRKNPQTRLEPAKKAAAPTTKSNALKKADPNTERAAPTKLGQLVELLSRKSGATIPEAMEVIGWQAHSVRGAISGALKNKRGLTVSSDVEGNRGRVYRIANKA